MTHRSFGPTVYHEPDGSFRPTCTWCIFRVGTGCTHVKPPKPIPDPDNTPEWCEMRESMIKDTQEMVAKRPVSRQEGQG